jgi:hypothetical protein
MTVTILMITKDEERREQPSDKQPATRDGQAGRKSRDPRPLSRALGRSYCYFPRINDSMSSGCVGKAAERFSLPSAVIRWSSSMRTPSASSGM